MNRRASAVITASSIRCEWAVTRTEASADPKFSYQQRYELEPRPRETRRKVDGARAEITRSMAKSCESVEESIPQPFSSLAVMRPKMEAEGGYPGQGGTQNQTVPIAARASGADDAL